MTRREWMQAALETVALALLGWLALWLLVPVFVALIDLVSRAWRLAGAG